jgi:formylglycine-generating enzyme required for sulfatase activity
MLTATETTLTSDYYISIYQTTRAQVARIMDVPSSNGYYNQVTPDAGQMFAAGHVCFQRGSNSVEGINWPFTKFAVTPTSIIGRFRARCGNRFWIDLPTCAQWQRAARPDTKWLFYDTSSYPGGMSGGEVGDSLDTITNIIARISYGYQRKYCGVGGVYSPPTTVGDLLPNAYGLYDLIGSRQELLLDQWNAAESAAASAGVDPVGMAEENRNSRMVNNSFSSYGTISSWSIAFAGSLNSDNPRNSSVENCYRYVIHLNPPQSFGGKWVNDAE